MRALPLILTACLLPLSLSAQEGPQGIAFVQAPEMSSGVAVGRTMEQAFANATQACVEGGAMAEDCLRTQWCYPAGWSIDIFAQHVEGLHWHEVQCGLPSREIGEQVAHALCDRTMRPYLIECMLVQVYDPSGTPMLAD